MSNIQSTSLDMALILKLLKVPFRTGHVLKHITTSFVVEELGTIFVVLAQSDFDLVHSKVSELYKGWKLIYIRVGTNFNINKYRIIFNLMRQGYFTWLRSVNNPTFILNMLQADNFYIKIIEERLRIWNNKPKYLYYIKTNIEAKTGLLNRLLTFNPGFFDYMPEDPNEGDYTYV